MRSPRFSPSGNGKARPRWSRRRRCHPSSICRRTRWPRNSTAGFREPLGWIAGRLARRRAGEMPGRVVRSAKSWLCHHSADRSAPILPWGSEDLAPAQKISPVRAAASTLNCLRGAWDSRFALSGCAFDAQEITITVPASFDAAAQRLTLNAAEEAGFPGSVRLLEEPQAAFYCWLEQYSAAEPLWEGLGPIHCRAAARLDRRCRRRHLGFQLVRAATRHVGRDPRHQAGRGQRTYPAGRRQYRSGPRSPAGTSACGGTRPDVRPTMGSPRRVVS